MKTRLTIFTMFAATGLFIVLFSGCYTQLGMTRDEQRSDREQYTSHSQESDSGNYAENDSEGYNDRGRSTYYNDDYYGSYPRYHAGFSY